MTDMIKNIISIKGVAYLSAALFMKIAKKVVF